MDPIPLSADIKTMDTMINTTMDAPMGRPNERNKADEAMDSFLQGLAPNNLEPLWSKMSAMVPPSPNPSDGARHVEIPGDAVPSEAGGRACANGAG